MSDFQSALLVRIQCNLEELATRREAMVAANASAWAKWKGAPPPPYGESDFVFLASQIAILAPDPHLFA